MAAKGGAKERAGTVVALVPAFQRADSIGATVQALRGVGDIDRILVVDDGSTDATAEGARRAGAEVLRLPINRGKGGAVAAGVTVCPEADVFLLIDADVGDSAGAAQRLVDVLRADEADLVVGVLPGIGRAGGFGLVRRLAAAGVRRACGVETRAPLSGQRAVRATYLRGLQCAGRFGLEVAMTIDAVRAGARLREVDVPMAHRRTGRGPRGLLHRGRQGADVVAALWPRLTTRRLRVMAALTLVTFGALAAGNRVVAPAHRPRVQVTVVVSDRVLFSG